MARTLPTEESLGLTPSDEELGTVSNHDGGDDDIALDTEHEAQTLANPGDKLASERGQAEAKEPSPDPASEPAKAAEPQMVDVRAVQEARAEAREAKQRASLLEQRWNEFLATTQPKQAEPEKPKIPDRDDPLARVDWAVDQLAAIQESQQRTTAEQARIQQEEAAFREAFTRADAEFSAAAQADPSIRDAYNVVREMRGRELMAFGFTEAQARQQLDIEEREQIMFVTQSNRSIVDHIKTMAELRGWRAKAAEPAPVARKPDLAAVAEAQQRHISLSDAPGGEGVPPLDAKALARMSDKEFKTWLSKQGNEAKFDQIMGG